MACYQAIASIDKRRILEIHSNGGDFLTLARSLGIKRTTAYTIVRRTNGQITPQKCRGWYNHTMTYIPDCLAMKPIDG